MKIDNNLLALVEIPESEKEEFDNLVKSSREKYIKKSSVVVDEVFNSNSSYLEKISKKDVSSVIKDLREEAYGRFLIEESNFNTIVLEQLSDKLNTPKQIIEYIIEKNITDKKGEDLIRAVKKTCGEYAGRISPYIYSLSLSNTQSRRSRAGKTFESIIYEIYNVLGYSFDSQGKVGRAIFDSVGLGKKVDSVLPGVEQFKQRRNKTIIGTMKTTLRERWQEVAEEIERTKIPEIHLLTVDDYLSESKVQEMSKHNIVIVVLKEVKEQKGLKDMKNIISFEEYFFEEIPKVLEFWKE